MKPRRRYPTPADYAAVEAAGQQSFAFATGFERTAGSTKRRSNRAQTTAVLHRQRPQGRAFAGRRPASPTNSPSRPRKSAPFIPTRLEIASFSLAFLLVPIVFYHVGFGGQISEINLLVFKVTELPKHVISGSLGCLSILVGPATLAGSIRWWLRCITCLRLRPIRFWRYGGIALIGALSQAPTFLCLTQTYETTRYVVRNAYQNVVNVYVVPHWPDPLIQRPGKARQRK
jgi:hypothetical protein